MLHFILLSTFLCICIVCHVSYARWRRTVQSAAKRFDVNNDW